MALSPTEVAELDRLLSDLSGELHQAQDLQNPHNTHNQFELEQDEDPDYYDRVYNK